MNIESQLHLQPTHITRATAEDFFNTHVAEVKRIAHRFSKKPFARHIHELDLVNAGLLGLIEAINRYNPENSSKFTPFARIRIRGAMLDEIRREDTFTRTDRRWLKRIQTATQTLTQTLGHEATQGEIAEALNLTPDHLLHIQHRFETSEEPLETLEPQKQIIGLPVQDVFSFSGEDPLRQLLQLENSKLVTQALDLLKPSERLTLRLSFYENLPLTRIAELLGVTLSRVSQIRTEALKKMKLGLKRFH